AISSSFIPNARRDYFNDNRTTQLFENELRGFFSRLGTLTQESSKLRNRKEEILVYKNKVKEYGEKLDKNILTKREEEALKEDLKKLRQRAIISEKEITKIQQKSTNDENLQIIHNSIIGDANLRVEGLD